MCRTCGVQFAPSQAPPPRCPICEDERQYVGWNGQQWTTLDDLVAEGRRNTIEELEPGLLQIATRPPVAIGQRALIAQTPAGNVMWDCVSLVDEASIATVREQGGLLSQSLRFDVRRAQQFRQPLLQAFLESRHGARANFLHPADAFLDGRASLQNLRRHLAAFPLAKPVEQVERFLERRDQGRFEVRIELR